MYSNRFSLMETVLRRQRCFETKDAIENGADEIDMVINVGWLKGKARYDLVLDGNKADQTGLRLPCFKGYN